MGTWEQHELLWPQVTGNWRESEKHIPKRGRISLLPEKKFKALRANVPVWRSARYDQGEQEQPLEFLQTDREVKGHVFGEWLLLSSLPSATSILNDCEEAWASMW